MVYRWYWSPVQHLHLLRSANSYTAQYAEQVNCVTPLGILADLYDKLCSLPILEGVSHHRDRESVRAVHTGIDDWSKNTKTTLSELLRLSEDKYIIEEKKLLHAVRDAVKRFVVSWDRKAKCDELYQQPIKKKMESVEKSNDLFKEYRSMPWGMR
jgi:hypothetical protein